MITAIVDNLIYWNATYKIDSTIDVHLLSNSSFHRLLRFGGAILTQATVGGIICQPTTDLVNAATTFPTQLSLISWLSSTQPVPGHPLHGLH